MNKQVYKTNEGRDIIESIYKKLLAEFTAFPFEQLFISTKKGKTHVLKFGDSSKPALIMIHGSTSNSATWLGCISYFIDDFCIYCVDIPGEPGLSEPNRCTLNSEEPYVWLDSLVSELKIGKAHFVTMSLGSWFALNYAINKPENVITLSLITSGGLVPAKASFIFKAVLYMMLGKKGQKMLAKAVYHKAEVPVEVLDFQALVSKHFNPTIEPLPIFNDAQLSKIISPIQFFGGECDSLIDTVKTGNRIISLFPNADVHILKDTGHVIIDQFPVIKDFINKNSK